MTALPRRSLGALAAVLVANLALRAGNARAANSRGDALLRAWDADHDGTLDLNEVKLVTADVRAADTDHDGSVTLDEYLALVQSRFEAADTNHDGKLDNQELHSNAGRTLMRLLK